MSDEEDDLRQDDEDARQELEDVIDETEEKTDEENSSEDEGNGGSEEEGSSEDGSEDEHEDEGGDEEENEDEDEASYDGVAPNKKSKKSKDGPRPAGKDFAPPGRGKWDGIKKEGKLIGEVLYEQVFLEFIEYLLKKAVDIPLDFADYVLFKSYKALTRVPPPKEKEEKTVFDYGREIEKGYAEKAAEGIGFYKKALNEVLQNIEKLKNGEPVEWKVLGEEPKWFNKAVALEKEARENPESEAAKKWERFKNSDKIIEGRLGNEAVYRIIATRTATFEEALKGEKFELPKDVVKKMKEMDDVLLNNDLDAAQLKAQMLEKINEMRTIVASGGVVNNAIKEKMNAMEAVATSGEEDVIKLKRAFKAPKDEIKDINPIAEHIKTIARVDYERITRNIDVIKEKYKDDPEKRIAVTSAYVNGIVDSLNKAQEDVIKYEEANRWSKNKFVQGAKNKVNNLINKAGSKLTNKDGDPLIDLKTKKEKAIRGVKSVRSAIDDFEVENKKISEYADATRRSSAPSSDKSSMLNQMSSYFRSR